MDSSEAEVSDRPLTCAFVMDPIESVDVRGDTTFVLMSEALGRGHRVLYVDPQDVTVAEGQAVARARPILELRREQGRHVDLGDAEEVVLDAATDLIFQRVDPPVDAEYITTTQILSLCRRALVLNRPEGILAANEKLYALRFAALSRSTSSRLRCRSHRFASSSASALDMGVAPSMFS